MERCDLLSENTYVTGKSAAITERLSRLKYVSLSLSISGHMIVHHFLQSLLKSTFLSLWHRVEFSTRVFLLSASAAFRLLLRERLILKRNGNRARK